MWFPPKKKNYLTDDVTHKKNQKNLIVYFVDIKAWLK